MIYKNDIANLALGYLGVTAQENDIDNSRTKAAEILRLNFPLALRRTLEAHDWGFATGFKTLSLISEMPDSGYAYRYSQPSDCLTIRQLAVKGNLVKNFELYEDQKHDFIEVQSGSGFEIHTDIADAEVEYTKLLSEDSVFPTYFGEAVAAKLAMMIAPALVTNNFAKIQVVLERNISRTLSESMAIDLGRKPRKKDPESPFVRAR